MPAWSVPWSAGPVEVRLLRPAPGVVERSEASAGRTGLLTLRPGDVLEHASGFEQQGLGFRVAAEGREVFSQQAPGHADAPIIPRVGMLADLDGLSKQRLGRRRLLSRQIQAG